MNNLDFNLSSLDISPAIKLHRFIPSSFVGFRLRSTPTFQRPTSDEASFLPIIPNLNPQIYLSNPLLPISSAVLSHSRSLFEVFPSFFFSFGYPQAKKNTCYCRKRVFVREKPYVFSGVSGFCDF
ncbi:hypothetical protein ERO13_A04G148233v2 [Gossypium hirsutum]|nr:hypothetical protein ERO13_A04G148233v2 [Gossypium hirsutum]